MIALINVFEDTNSIRRINTKIVFCFEPSGSHASGCDLQRPQIKGWLEWDGEKKQLL